MAVGTESGKIVHTSLLMPTITSIIILQIICAENGVIQHHWMGLHQILWLLIQIERETNTTNKPLIHRYCWSLNCLWCKLQVCRVLFQLELQKVFVDDRGCRSDRSAYGIEVTHTQLVLWWKMRLQENRNFTVIDGIDKNGYLDENWWSIWQRLP